MKKGFTLMELMVAIVIVGILAAVIAPNYTEGVRKAKLSEFFEMFSRIRVKEEQYFSESKAYLPISKADWKEELRTNFEMSIEAQFFDYEVEVPEPDSFVVTATLKKSMGRAKAGAQAKVDQNGRKWFENDPEGGLASYTSGWQDLIEN